MVLLSKMRLILFLRSVPARSMLSFSRCEHSKPNYSLPPGYSAPAVAHNKAKVIPPEFVEAYNHGTGMEPDPITKWNEFCDEPHVGEKSEKLCWLMILFVIPAFSIYAFYIEYQHLSVKHRHRKPYPRFEFMHQRNKPMPFSWDGEHTYWHHPYWNFFKDGYETDKDGNLLPKGTFVPE